MTRKGVMAAVLGAGLGLAVQVPAAFAAEPITGRWVTAEKDAVIVIAPCGKALCGTIERFLVAPPQGNDQRDINNPDAAKRKRKLLATTPILSAFTQESNLWRGQIYDPKSGKSYRSVVRRKGPNLLEVKGCIGPFCQT
ncbi:MAG: DUF2147 domain-containing protein, partial [Erythrobacter sp.]|nr:DUF2147 domain-containing protein [Erythrobacter sp.]